MYAVVVYDVGVKRVNRIKKILREYMTWIQNSVFEGELTEAEFMELKKRIKDAIDKNSDAVHFYIVKTEKYMKKETLGTPKAEHQTIF